MINPKYILELAIPTRLWHRVDYLPPEGAEEVEKWQPGIRIQVPFGRRIVVGVLLTVKLHTEVPLNKLKLALNKLDNRPLLTDSLLKLCQWTSDYYHYPLGEVVIQALPKLLRQGRECPDLTESADSWGSSLKIDNVPPDLILNEHQCQAIAAITRAQTFKIFLLNGITGSGKTEVYFHSILALLQSGKQALVLVPEIGLTPQMIRRFEERFNVPIVLLHSDLSDRIRSLNWLKASEGKAAIVIGTRSAVFTPLLKPSIIILDEEHDISFKQQSSLRYSARDLAIVRGQLENIPVILGSATPSLESFYNCRLGRYHYLSLPLRAGGAQPPRVDLINLQGKRLTAGLSQPLIDAMRAHLIKGGQVLLFLNRRGYASVLMCHQCGWMANCTRCDARLTLHLQPERLHCHHCGVIKPLPLHCEKCRHCELIRVGQGTERIEQIVSEEFPDYSVVRIDRDNTRRKGSIQKLLKQIDQQEAKILIGTQMLAKGHHFPHLTLVAIVEADSGLFSLDFRGLERMGQLLVQIAGRAGRAQHLGEVIIQTHHPDHPHLQILLNKGYHQFVEALMLERQQASLPPFTYLALMRAEALKREPVQKFLLAAKAQLANYAEAKNISLLGPIPSPMERCAGKYRGQLLLQSKRRGHLQEILKKWVFTLLDCPLAKKVHWSLDIDPQEMF